MGRDWQRDYLPRPQWQADRLPANAHAMNPRYHQHEHHELHEQPSDLSRPLSIDRALREQCRIPAQFYFVSAILDSGEAVTFSGPTEYKERIPDFFNMDKWVRCATGHPPSATNFLDDQEAGFNEYGRPDTRSYSRQGHLSLSSQGMGMSMEYDGRRPMDRRRMQGFDTFDEDFRNRKRPRASTSRRPTDMVDEMPARMTQPTKTPVQIQDQEIVWGIYDQRFRSLQQTACKLIAKAWVKLVEPKKQSTHPYTGSDEKAPDWWPKPWGLSREERVRHKEPDHLYKKERVHLLKHILRMVVQPNAKQHPDIQKLHLNVVKLEEATNEALSGFFTDKDAPNNAKKRPYLKEIFYLARHEEKYLRDEIDGCTNVYVMSDDKIPDNYQSDNEDSSPVKDDDEDGLSVSIVSPHRPSVTQTLMQPTSGPTTTISAAVSPTAPGSDHSPGSSLPPGAAAAAAVAQPFLGDLPHRNHPPYPPPHLLHPEISSEQHTNYVDNSGIAVGSNPNSMSGTHGGMPLQEMCPDPHESSRRPSLFSPTAEFSGAPSNASPVYQGWSHTTTAPSTSPLYSFTPQQAQVQAQAQAQAQAQVQQAQAHHSSYVSQPSVPIQPQNQGYMGHSFESLPRGSYETPHETLFRSGNVPAPNTVSAPTGYPLHMAHHDAREVANHGLKLEQNPRGHLR